MGEKFDVKGGHFIRRKALFTNEDVEWKTRELLH
jgi:hypothetical protein